MEDPSAEMEIGTSPESFGKFLDSQRELFHSQIDQLQRIVGTQCKLTGVNPLSQEMAAGALSIKIDGPIAGKRPRDLLNPKAIKYMQSVFSIKDSISKKESRELNALFGITVTQVRDFFNSQRSRVRKLVQLSREKALKSGEHKDLQDGVSTSPDSLTPSDPVPLNSVGPANVEDAPSCSTQDDAPSGLDDLDKCFVEDIFNLMRKEETFSGQVKLMEWILRIQNSSVLCWFLTKGGVMILVTWLSQAAVEEQTNVLLVILKVLCHLPLHKALPLHMSAVLQSVNRLRFYRTADISNRARVLLSRWSKLLAKNQALEKPNGIKTSSDSGQELVILKQSIDEVMGDESWKSNMDISEDFLGTPFETAENFRKVNASEPLKLLTASSDESNKKNILGVSSSQFRERRKVQLVEQPGQKSAGRSVQATRTTPVSQARPMSADDIQKAKMRAQFMQSKYGKSGSSHENKELKTEGVKKLKTSQASILPVVPKVPIRSNIEEPNIPATYPLKERETPNRPETTIAPKRSMDLKEPILEKCRRIQIPWKMPPEIKLDPSWSVGGGENGKENEVQRNRNRREKEIIYRTVQETPSNPKEPWDIEMDYDDSLTPEIPIEQPPDVADSTETQAFPREYNPETMVVPSQGANSGASLPPALSQINKASAAEPDLELLAVLLKNPELVFALTSGQAANLSSEDTVKLLDMIKSGGAGVAGSVNGLGRKMEERVEVSLPSPTPSSNPGTSGWKGDAGRNAFPQQMPQVSSAHRSIPPERLSTPQPAVPSYSPEYYPMQTPASEMTSITKNTHFHNLSNMTVPSVWGESTSNVERAPLSTSYNLAEMQQPLFSNMARQQRQPQPLQQQQRFSTPTYSPNPPMGKAVPPSESWRARQDLTSNYHYLENQNQYNASHGGHLQPHLSGPWEGYERVGSNQDFHSWSPDDDDSPSRNPGYMYGREPRTNPGRDYTSRGRNPAGYRGHTRQRGNRWPNRGGD